MPKAINEPSASDAPLSGIPYELRIGVTGHRDLADPVAVGDAITSLFQRLAAVLTSSDPPALGWHRWVGTVLAKLDAALANGLAAVTAVLCPAINQCFRLARFPGRWHWPVIPFASSRETTPTTTIKFTGISCLAEGSDQLFIQQLDRFLRQSPPQGVIGAAFRNRYVEAVLPYPVDLYERDFQTKEGLSNFHVLLALDRGLNQQHTAPTVVSPGFPVSDSGGTITRTSAFGAAGRYVVECSEILVAIWDPERAELPGGTGEAARFALECGRQVVWLNPNRMQENWRMLRRVTDDHGAVPEPSEQNPSIPPGLIAVPLPLSAQELSSNFYRFAEYNRKGAVVTTEFAAAKEDRTNRFSCTAAGKLPNEVTAAIGGHIIPHVVRAELLSRRYRELRDAAARLWPIAAALAVTLMSFQIVFLPALYWLGWIEILLLLTCAGFYRVSVREAWHDLWRINRRLAEALRTALYTSLVIDPDDAASSGSRQARHEAVGKGVENPLPFYDPGQSWLVAAIKRIIRRQRRAFARNIDWNRDLQGIASFLAEDWVRGQAAYHRTAAARHHRVAQRLAYWRLILVVLIVLVAVLHAMGIGHSETAHGVSFHSIDSWIAWATVALPAWAAAVHALSTSEDHERLSARSRRMAPLLDALAERLERVATHSQLADCVRECETLLDLESQEWAESLSERRPEFAG